MSAAVVHPDSTVSTRGDPNRPFHLASISKILSTWAILVAIEEGSIRLETPVGQPGCTLRHLLCHAGGYGFDGPTPITKPGRNRIYSNTGIELAADALTHATGMDFATYLREAIIVPLGMGSTGLVGSPAHGVTSTVNDLALLCREILTPTLLSATTVTNATTPHFGELGGVVPGIGSFRPCPWGLGVEVHGTKNPHWMGTTNSANAFGHFGGAGTMMWLEPDEHIALIALTDHRFDLWSTAALRLWPDLSDSVLAQQRRTP